MVKVKSLFTITFCRILNIRKHKKTIELTLFKFSCDIYLFHFISSRETEEIEKININEMKGQTMHRNVIVTMFNWNIDILCISSMAN